MTTHTDNHPPYPRLWHCPPGTMVQLTGESAVRTIERIERGYALFNNGMLAVSLGHRVNQCVRERINGKWEKSGPDLMVFGAGGWQPESSREPEATEQECLDVF